MPSLAYKILGSHLLPQPGGPTNAAELRPGDAIKLRIDNTLTQDATGTMAYLQFEEMGVDRIRTRAVSYVDHNTLQSGFMNADDHRYLQSVADRYGARFSKAGNGICHQVQLERFDRPGETLLGSDSHTPTAGAMAMIAMGAGGLDVACAMAGLPYAMRVPEVVAVKLTGSLPHGVSAKDIILKVLQIKSVKGGVGKIFEYIGPGIKSLSVPERSTITNMGAELGATTSIFPSDENTLEFLTKQGRPEDFRPLGPDPDAHYDEVIEIDLSTLEPLVALPHSPDNVRPVAEVAGLKLDQVCIGSCTNSSYTDLLNVARILRGQHIHPDVDLTLSFGSSQVLRMLADDGALTDIIASGARLLEAACGPCIGMGQSPRSEGVSLRTFNRNFYGRSGTESAGVYLCSPETAAVSALRGCLTDPREVEFEKAELPASYSVDDRGILEPSCDPDTPILKGPNIKSVPLGRPLEPFRSPVLIKLEDNITTDHIIPGGATVLPYRSNIEKISEFCFMQVDPDFAQRAKEQGGGFIIAGSNYGQGSSREHAALAPLYLGVRAVIANSYARIHRQNLINSAILPLIFRSEADYEALSLLDQLEIRGLEPEHIRETLKVHEPLTIHNDTTGQDFLVDHDLNEEEIELILQGGLLRSIRAKQKQAQEQA